LQQLTGGAFHIESNLDKSDQMLWCVDFGGLNRTRIDRSLLQLDRKEFCSFLSFVRLIERIGWNRVRQGVGKVNASRF